MAMHRVWFQDRAHGAQPAASVAPNAPILLGTAEDAVGQPDSAGGAKADRIKPRYFHLSSTPSLVDGSDLVDSSLHIFGKAELCSQTVHSAAHLRIYIFTLLFQLPRMSDIQIPLIYDK